MRATAPRLTYGHAQTPDYWGRSIYCALPVPRGLHEIIQSLFARGSELSMRVRQ